jgi:hypothetical protein
MRITVVLFFLVESFLNIGSLCADVKNESQIIVSGHPMHEHAYAFGGTDDLFKICKGTLPERSDILKLLPASAFADGVNCIPQEFDKNGFLDFLIHYKGYTFLIFFKGASVLRTQAIQDPLLDPFDEKDPGRNRYPTHRGQAGLIHPDGGDGGHVYFLNSKTGVFEEVQYVPDPSQVYSD